MCNWRREALGRLEFRSLPSRHSFSAFSRQPFALTSSLNLSFCLLPLAFRCARDQICTNLQKSAQLPISHVDRESPKTLKPNEFRNHLEGPNICAQRQLLLSPAENRTVNETNVVHLTQEKHPASQQVSSEDPDSASIQGVRLQAIEATAPAGAPDG